MPLQLPDQYTQFGDRGATRRVLAAGRAIAVSAGLPSALAYVDCELGASLLYDDQHDSAAAAVQD